MIKKEFGVEFNSPVALCDIEIKNDISSDSEWDYESSDIITLGIFYGDKITILQREKSDNINLWKNTLLQELKDMPVMFCLNVNMEKRGIKGFLGLNRFFEEIRPFKGKNTSKDKLFKYLVSENRVQKELIPEDPLNGKSSLVQNKYAENKYEEIILHNKSCLIKEYFIFMNKFWLLNRFKDKIKDGWWIDTKPFGGQ